MKKIIFKYFISAILLIFLSMGCNENVQSPVPNLPVHLELNLTTSYSTFKNSTNQYLLFEKPIFEMDRIGFGGILVCSGITLDDSGNSIYYAFDMSCPVEVSQNVKVYPVQDDLGKVACEKCGSVFDVGLGYGYPVSGPAKVSLRRYRTSLSGNVLLITNL